MDDAKHACCGVYASSTLSFGYVESCQFRLLQFHRLGSRLLWPVRLTLQGVYFADR